MFFYVNVFKKIAIAHKCLGRIRTLFQICVSKDPDPEGKKYGLRD